MAPDLKNMSVDDVTKLVTLATVLISGATKLGFMVADIVQKSKEISSEDKDEMIARIKTAQASVPEWTEDEA